MPASSVVKHPRRLLILRFSALGDVAMTVPVVASLAAQYPQMQITVASQPFLAPLFDRLAPNVQFFGADIRKAYRGLRGLWQLSRTAPFQDCDAVADLHDVLRTKILRCFLRLRGKRLAVIDKHRREKRLLVEHKIFRPLPTSFALYAETLARLGLPVKLNFERLKLGGDALHLPFPFSTDTLHEPWLGLAPFAAHEGKIYPLEQMTEVVRLFFESHSHGRLFVFGSRKEMEMLRPTWGKGFERLVFVCDILKGLDAELQLMARLNAMVSMDSGNMHLASLVGCPVVSIWGQTHPFAGFMGYHQAEENVVQQDLHCRPCSIFGNAPCRYGDFRCLRDILPQLIIDKVEEIISPEQD